VPTRPTTGSPALFANTGSVENDIHALAIYNALKEPATLRCPGTEATILHEWIMGR
jgi:hypothetical protein